MVRFKNRYLLIELLPFFDNPDSENEKRGDIVSQPTNSTYSSLNFTPASVSAHIRRSVEQNYGVSGASSILQSLSVKYSNKTTMMIIVRVPRDFFQEIWTSVTLLTDFPTDTSTNTDNTSSLITRCTWRVVHCAGTIRSCQKSAISYSRTLLKEMQGLGDETLEAESIAKRIKLIDP